MNLRPLILPLLLMAANANAIFINWTQYYHVGSNDEVFTSTVTDPLGNTYVVGTSDNGPDVDALVVKYGPGGSLHWAIKFTGSGDQVGKLIALSPDGSQLYAAFERPNGGIALSRLNPASGAVVWTHPFNPSAGRTMKLTKMFVEQGTSYNRVHFPFEDRPLVGDVALAIYTVTDYNALFSGVYESAGGPDRHVLDLEPKPGGNGGYILIGEGSGPANATILPYHGPSVLDPYIDVSEATCLAVTPTHGGQLFAAGAHTGNHIKLYRIPTANNTIATTSDHVLSGATGAAILDLATDGNGDLYACGYEVVPSFDKEAYLARYRYSDLARLWRTPRESTTQAERYLAVGVDAYGTVGVALQREAIQRMIGVYLYDTSGTFLYYSTYQATAPQLALFDLAASPSGLFTAVGSRWDGGHSNGYATQVGPDGLKALTTPQASYTGGSGIAMTAWMYVSKPTARSVTLSSSEPSVVVPTPISIAANTTSKGFSVTTQPTPTDLDVTISAYQSGARRTKRITILAPRPSSVSLTPLTVQGGSSSAGKVYLTGKAPTAGVTVDLASSNPAATVPASVMIPSGSYSGLFTVSTTVVAATAYCSITASLNGTTKARTLTVTP